VVERLTNNIDTFHINPNGTLGPLVINPSAGAGAFSGRFAPDGKLIVSETGSTISAISSYTVPSDGKLSAVTQSLTTNGDANCWNAITPDGAFVYASNAGSSNISGFSIGQSGALTALTSSSVVASNPAHATNLDITVSGDGKFVYSAQRGSRYRGCLCHPVQRNADGSGRNSRLHRCGGLQRYRCTVVAMGSGPLPAHAGNPCRPRG
jgi:6-phosphogluconolactonase